MTAKEKAQAIIAASFKEVKQDLARKANAGQHCCLFVWGWGWGVAQSQLAYSLTPCPLEQVLGISSWCFTVPIGGADVCNNGYLCLRPQQLVTH